MISPAAVKTQSEHPTHAAVRKSEHKPGPQIGFSCVDNPTSVDSQPLRIPISKKQAQRCTSHTDLMTGFVPTPPEIVDLMVDRLFRGRLPTSRDVVLDPGCGTGIFLAGVIRWCAKHGAPTPKMVGIESEPHRASVARANLGRKGRIQIRSADFLSGRDESFDFIVGNPPYVAIYGFSAAQKRDYRARYDTARGRFDLYLLFFERALKSLKPGGRMVFITPEKFLYVETAAPLRQLLSGLDVEEIDLVNEETFAGLVTYPTITTVVNRPTTRRTVVRLRNGNCRLCSLHGNASWMPTISGVARQRAHSATLKDICVRVSCGVATGADDVFVRELDSLEPQLMNFARPTIAGRELTRPVEIPQHRKVMLIPYEKDGVLLLERELGPLLRYLLNHQRRLLQRTCVVRKPWYAFHETPPLRELLRPKILCKDITERPYFWKDPAGSLVPRHSVYYIVPTNANNLDRLCSYLNSTTVSKWLAEHCQRVANGFLRLQSNVLKLLPVPDELVYSQPRSPRPQQQYYLNLSGTSEGLRAR